MPQYTRFPVVASGSWKAPVASAAALPATGNTDGDVRIVLDTETIYVWNGTAWILEVAPGATPPGGSTTQVQYNNAGAFAGSSGLTYNSGTGVLTTILSLQTTEDIYVDKGRTDTYTATGSVLYPYKTIQAAINAIQAAADNTNAKPYQIVIAAGAYSEALTMSGANLVNIVMTGLGAVAVTSLTCTVANTWDVFSVSGVSISTMTCTGASDAGTPWGIGSEFRSCVFGDVTFTNISTAYIKESTIAGNLVVTNVIGSGFQRGQITGTTTVTYDAGAPKPSGISFTFLVLEGALTVGDITVGAGAFVQPRIGCRIGLPGGNTAVAGNFTSYTSFIRSTITIASTGTFVNNGSFYDPATLVNSSGGTFTNNTYAETIRNVAAGNLAATNVQSALNELQGDINTLNTNTAVIAASFYGAAATAIASGTTTYIDFPTQTGDTNNAVLGEGSGNVTTSGTGWRFIVPATGWYNISATIVQAAQAQTTSQYLVSYLVVNGTVVRSLGATYGNGTANYFRTSGMVNYPLTLNDRVEIGLIQNIGSITLYNSNEQSVSINRI